jgi:hypothetical protein
MIYTTFKQWVKGRFLETGEPRKQAYSKDELALIEMGWGYGYDAGVEAEREACAKLVEQSSLPDAYSEECLPDIADEIRARGDKA